MSEQDDVKTVGPENEDKEATVDDLEPAEDVRGGSLGTLQANDVTLKRGIIG